MDYAKRIDAFSDLFSVTSYKVDTKTGQPEIIAYNPGAEVVSLFKKLFEEQVIFYNEGANSPISLSFYKSKLIDQMFNLSQKAESLLKEYEKLGWFTQQLLKKEYTILEEKNGALVLECELLCKDSDTVVVFR